jgi:hypothetical protein
VATRPHAANEVRACRPHRLEIATRQGAVGFGEHVAPAVGQTARAFVHGQRAGPGRLNLAGLPGVETIRPHAITAHLEESPTLVFTIESAFDRARPEQAARPNRRRTGVVNARLTEAVGKPARPHARCCRDHRTFTTRIQLIPSRTDIAPQLRNAIKEFALVRSRIRAVEPVAAGAERFATVLPLSILALDPVAQVRSRRAAGGIHLAIVFVEQFARSVVATARPQHRVARIDRIARGAVALVGAVAFAVAGDFALRALALRATRSEARTLVPFQRTQREQAEELPAQVLHAAVRGHVVHASAISQAARSTRHLETHAHRNGTGVEELKIQQFVRPETTRVGRIGAEQSPTAAHPTRAKEPP